MSKQLFLIPVGLPGLGKTTLSKLLGEQAGKMFHRISYDAMIIKHQIRYQEQHPDVPFHQVIDIIRPLADKEYLETISFTATQIKEQRLVYLDRNNTPDIWNDIARHVPSENCVLLVPKQTSFPLNVYNRPNPISPNLFYHSAKRIFQRKEHDCLSGADKPKAIEVLLKFTRLYDYSDFTKSPFGSIEHVEYGLHETSLRNTEYDAIIWGINNTPDNFVPPQMSVIEQVIKACEKQIVIDDEQYKEPIKSPMGFQYQKQKVGPDQSSIEALLSRIIPSISS